MLKEIYRRFQFSLILVPLFFIAACQGARQTSITMWLQADTPTLVNFPLSASAQIYSFTANPSAATQLTVSTVTPNLPYTAEVHDSQGNVIGTIGQGLQNAVFTIAPGNGLYEVAIKADDSNQQGMLSVTVGGLTANPASLAAAYSAPLTNLAASSPKAISFAGTGSSCSAQSSSASNVNIRNGPGMNYAVIGSLAAGSSIPLLSRSDNDWYQVNQNGQAGWISGSVILITGTCNSLETATPQPTPIPLPTLIPTVVIADPDAFHLNIDRDTGGAFSQNLAYNDPNHRDLILVSVDNLSDLLGDNFREFILTLICSGNGTNQIRWGAPDEPTLGCGYSVTMPFTPDYNRQVIAVSLPDATQLSAVSYTLMAAKR